MVRVWTPSVTAMTAGAARDAPCRMTMNANTGDQHYTILSKNRAVTLMTCLIFRPCDVFAHCTNNIGSYECTCFPGYEGDGHKCQGRSSDSDDNDNDIDSDGG